jgi:8-amino-7-oxononanoate synthase
VAAAREAVRICASPEGPDLFGRSLANAAYLANGLHEIGFRVLRPDPLEDGTEVVTPIVPIFVGDDLLAASLWKALWDEGMYTNVALYPAVPPAGALIRTSVMATHERAHLDRALEIAAAVKQRFPEQLPGPDGP